jgi:class 3 adenylate cyclase
MNINVLQSQIDRAQQEHEKGNFAAAEKTSNEVLFLLPEENKNAENWALIQSLRSRALCRLSFSLSNTQRVSEALALAENSLAAAIEAKSKLDEATANEAIAWCYRILGNELLSLEYFQRSFAISEQIGYKTGIAKGLRGMGVIYCDGIADYSKALESFGAALNIFEETGDKYQIALTFADFGTVYINLKLYDKVLEYCTLALAIFNEIGSKHLIANSTLKLGAAYNFLGMYDKALEYFGKALSVDEEFGNRSGVANALANIGIIHVHRGEFTLALEYFSQALAIFQELGNKRHTATQTGNIGEIHSFPHFEGYDPVKSEEYLLKAIALNEELGKKPDDQYRALAELYQNEQQWEKSNRYFRKYHTAEKESANEAARKKAAQLEQQRELANREKILIIERAHARATKELLHKTLPPSIADRVIQGELRIADHFESVSILFADVVGFTKISSKMPPAAVLAFMNFIFEHFDGLAAKHGCERIKTIGDGYMAVCGAPVRYPNHAERLALMALDMMEDIILPEDIREHLPKGTLFHLRIGLHCGEITAGLIGTGKLAYDIYGDAVNTAARMESHGEAGKIHCSGAFARELGMRNEELGMEEENAQLVIRNSQFIIYSRGEMEVKGKGIMTTYFLEKA